jgi:hypothetical protein
LLRPFDKPRVIQHLRRTARSLMAQGPERGVALIDALRALEERFGLRGGPVDWHSSARTLSG